MTDFQTLWKKLQTENFYWKIGFYALAAAGIVHALFIPLFLSMGLGVMAAFNILSVFIYWFSIFGLGMEAIESRNDALIGWLVYFELITHNTLATYFLGTEAGFQYYIYTLAFIPFFVFTYKRYIYLLRILGAMVISLLIEGMPIFESPKIPIQPEALDLLHLMNLFVFLVILSALSYLYSIHAKAHHEHLEDGLYRDPLTGLYNRRFIYDLLKNILNRTGDWKRPGMLLIDIDHFKRINDTYGHDRGDIVIKKIADLLADNLFDAIIARWGGEEFLVLFRETDEKRLAFTAEQIRQIVEAHPCRQEELEIPLTITVGGCVMEEDESFHSALKRSDLALYRGKQEGRNRTVIDSDDL